MITVSEEFHAAANGQVIQPTVGCRFSFTKETSEDVTYFTLDKSVLNGPDLLASGDNNPIQLWDTYEYTDLSNRLVKAEWSRSTEFPYGVQSALADVTLNNYDDYFTPGAGSAIDQYNFPKRPFKLYAGYQGVGQVNQLYGLTQEMPAVSFSEKTARYHIMDYVSEIAEQTLTEVVTMEDARTDQVLAAIVEQFGVLPSQYKFEKGTNTIPFVFFDKGQNAGDAIRKLVQAEGGKFWQDEQGQLRFFSRVHQYRDAAIVLPGYSILRIEPKDNNGLVNRVKITADIREVQEFQTVFTKSPSGDSVSAGLWVVPAGATYSADASLSDPCLEIIPPTVGRVSSVSWFTAKTSNGQEVTSGVTATGELTTNAYKLTFTNTHAYDVEIDEMTLWGEPAKVVDVIDYDAYDDESVEKYGESTLEITDNEFFQRYQQCDTFATTMLAERAGYNSELEIDIKGNFAMQLGDVIQLDYKYPGEYVVDSIAYTLAPGQLLTTIKVHKHNKMSYFVLDESALNGTDILG